MNWTISDNQNYTHACNCVGPQRGEPLCPCQMRGVMIRDGRYILPEQDLGPVKSNSDKENLREKQNILNR